MPKAPSLIPQPPGGRPGQKMPQLPYPGQSTAPSSAYDPLKVAVNDIGGSFLPFLRTQDDQVTRGVDFAAALPGMVGGMGSLLKRYLIGQHGLNPDVAHTIASGFTQHIGDHLGIAPNMPADLVPATAEGEAAYNAVRQPAQTMNRAQLIGKLQPNATAKDDAYQAYIRKQIPAKPQPLKIQSPEEVFMAGGK
jgi:hypothetical protein